MKKMMNEDLPYEQQMKPILEKYDKLVEENLALKEKANELERYKAYARTPGEVKDLVGRIEKQKEAIDWSIAQINEYLRSLGVDARYKTLKSAVNAITKI